jgi:hypothetical protein
MNRAGLAIALVLAWSAMQAGVRAQSPGVPEPILRVTIDPPRVVVGQSTTLRLEVLAPNYMTAPPALPDFQLRNAVTRQLPNVNLTEQRDGTTYAGVRFEFAIHPLEPGRYAIGGRNLTVRYAADPPHSREATLPLRDIAFQAFVPDAAAGLAPFVSATALTIEQAVQRSSETLKVGDAVTRIVTVKGMDVPAMLLPPVKLAPVDGLALYPAQPSVQDRTDSRTAVLSSTRVDAATYMLERPGEFLLPAIEVGWWNAAAQKSERAHIDAVTLQVAPNPAVDRPAPLEQAPTRWTWHALLDFISDHWLLAALSIAALGALAWISPRAVRAIAARHRRRREGYLQSEAWAFARLRAAARHRDPSGNLWRAARMVGEVRSGRTRSYRRSLAQGGAGSRARRADRIARATAVRAGGPLERVVTAQAHRAGRGGAGASAGRRLEERDFPAPAAAAQSGRRNRSGRPLRPSGRAVDSLLRSRGSHRSVTRVPPMRRMTWRRSEDADPPHPLTLRAPPAARRSPRRRAAP